MSELERSTQPTELEYARSDRTLRLISVYLGMYGSFAGLISAIPFGLAFFTPETGSLGFVIASTILGIYGIAAAGLMFHAMWVLHKRRVMATRTTRFAMVVALPGSALTALIALIGLVVLIGSYSDGATSDPGLFLGGLAVTVIAGSIMNIAILIRLLTTDIDRLLWATEAKRGAFNDTLNFIE